MSSKKSYILALVNFLLELGCSYFLYNGIICHIFAVPELDILKILGLTFVVSWVKSRPGDFNYSSMKESTESKAKDADTFSKTIYYSCYFAVSLIIYLAVKFI